MLPSELASGSGDSGCLSSIFTPQEWSKPEASLPEERQPTDSMKLVSRPSRFGPGL
jgi:hypothetical protein